MKKLLVSACLLGDKVRYDGRGKYVPEVRDLNQHFELVLVCPEFEALQRAPRKKMELVKGALIDEDGRDLTIKVLKSIEDTVRLCKYLGITGAVLKSKSPTCGNKNVYDGSFKGVLIEGQGLLAKELKKAGITVYNEMEIERVLIDYRIIKPEIDEEENPKGE